MKVGAAYIRVSDDRQDEYSPDSQLKKIMEYAKKEGYEVNGKFIFFDDGISAKSADKRTEFKKMIALAKENPPPFNAVFVWKFSRFARNQEESIVYKSLLKKNGVELVSVSEPLIDGPFGTLIERIIEWMDEYYLINLSAEVKRGMTEKAERGEAMTRPVLGYDLSGKTYKKNSKSVIVEEVFSMYLDGHGLSEIAKMLADRGILTINGNPPDARWVAYQLHNPVYIGKIRWSANGRAASRRDYKNNSILISDGLHEPIIEREIWDSVQKKLNNEKKTRSSYINNVYLSKGIVKCGSCGSSLVRQTTGYLQCCSYARGKCRISHSINIKKVNSIFKKLIADIINGYEDQITKINTNITSSSAAKSYDIMIDEEKRKIARMRLAYQSGVDTLDEYMENKKAASLRLEKLIKAKNTSCSCSCSSSLPDCYTLRTVLISGKGADNEALYNAILRKMVSKAVYRKGAAMEIYFDFKQNL